MIGCLWTHVHKQPIIALYLQFETLLKFYNLEAWFCNVIMCICSSLSIVSLGKRGLVLVLLRLCLCMFVCSLVSAIVSLSLGTMDWSVVPECDISWSYSLVCFNNTDTLQMQLIDNN